MCCLHLDKFTFTVFNLPFPWFHEAVCWSIGTWYLYCYCLDMPAIYYIFVECTWYDNCYLLDLPAICWYITMITGVEIAKFCRYRGCVPAFKFMVLKFRKPSQTARRSSATSLSIESASQWLSSSSCSWSSWSMLNHQRIQDPHCKMGKNHRSLTMIPMNTTRVGIDESAIS